MKLVEVILRNTTSKIRWLFSLCNWVTRKLAEQISSDANVALTLVPVAHSWSYPMGIIITFADAHRRDRIITAWKTRKCSEPHVYAHCYHLVRALGVDIRLTLQLCARGNIDVILYAIDREVTFAHTTEQLHTIQSTPAMLINNGHVDAAMRVLKLIASYPWADQVKPAFLMACYATYMGDNRDSIIANIKELWPRSMIAPEYQELEYASRCQRRDITIVGQPVSRLLDLFTLIAALCGGETKRIIWCARGVRPGIINNAVNIISKSCAWSQVVSLSAFKLIMRYYTSDIQVMLNNSNMPAEYINAALTAMPW